MLPPLAFMNMIINNKNKKWVLHHHCLSEAVAFKESSDDDYEDHVADVHGFSWSWSYSCRQGGENGQPVA